MSRRVGRLLFGPRYYTTQGRRGMPAHVELVPPPAPEGEAPMHEFDVVTLAARINALEQWQERQNGSLGRIENKVDKLYTAIITMGAAVFVSMLGVILTFVVTH